MIRSERMDAGSSGQGAVIDSGAAETATKVATQAAALLSSPRECKTPESDSAAPLSSLVVSVGRVPSLWDMNADSMQEAFRKIHDPVPRPAGADSSEVLVSVYTRFLRHSDSSIVQGSKVRAASAAGSFNPGATFPQDPKAVDGSVPDYCSEPHGILYRASEDLSRHSEASKKRKGTPIPAEGHRDKLLVGQHRKERQEAADKLATLSVSPGVPPALLCG